MNPENIELEPIRRDARDAELARAGWKRRFVGGGPRLEEIVRLYESLGHEVLLDRLTREELAEECGDCSLALDLFRVIYTRPASRTAEDRTPRE